MDCSRGKLFTNHEQEKLEHINNYLNKQNNGEYITELSPKKGEIITQEGFVLAKHITVNAWDRLCVNPTTIHRKQVSMETPGGKLHQSDRRWAKNLAPTHYQNFLLKSASMESYYYSLIESMITTLRELNEELPFTTVLKFTDNEQHVWISANINKDISKTEYEIHNTLSFFDISQPYIELYSDDFYRYKNRRPESWKTENTTI